MANETESRAGRSMEPGRTGRTRMKGGYGRESVGRPDETGIRPSSQRENTRQPEIETDQGPPSRQTSTAEDMSGQL